MFNVFTALSKSKSEEISKIAKLLDEKEASDITFTAIDPKTGALDEYVLGSIEGNSKFLLGYCNPGFKVAPYHFILIDPTIDEEDADEIYNLKGHPSNPDIWARFNVEPFLEGDESGKPHDLFRGNTNQEDDSYEFTFKGKSYIADPKNQLVYSTSDEKVYHWSLLRNTFFSSQNPELTQLMDLNRIVKLVQKIPAEQSAEVYKGFIWDDSVLPLVKGVLPKPGSLIKINNNVLGLVTNRDIKFINKEGLTKSINLMDTEVFSLDLSPEGPGCLLLLDFFKSYFNIDIDALESYT